MSEELEAVEAGTDPRDEQIKDLEVQVALLQAQVDAARPALVRDAISTAGFDPMSQEGRILQELAKTPDFRLTPEHVSARAEELGFEPSEPIPRAANRTSETANPEFEVPPGRVKDQSLIAKNRELAAAVAATLPTVEPST